jgi:hypothetical protein
MTRFVFATFRQVGFHHWPDAPDAYAYLRPVHRHEFHVHVFAKVGGANREIEFIEFKKTAHSVFCSLGEMREGVAFFGASSCEMLAEQLGRRLQLLGYTVTNVTVSEDGENGGMVLWEELLSQS